MKTVVDTNVLISGIFFDGPPAQILKAWLHGQLEFVVSHEILEEYFEVCERLSLRYPNIDITQILILIVPTLSHCGSATITRIGLKRFR